MEEIVTALLVCSVWREIGSVRDDDLRVWAAPLLFEDDVEHLEGGDRWREEVLGDTGLHNLRVGDVDGDGDLDVFGSNYIENPPVRLYRNQSAGG